MINKIEIKEKINLKSTLDGGQAFRWHNIKGNYRGVIGNQVLTLSTRNNIIYIENNSLNKNRLNKRKLRKYLGLDSNQEYLKNKYINNKYISKMINLNSDLRILCQDPWEVIVGFITSSVSNVPKIKNCMNKLSILSGEKIGNSVNDYIFPEPIRILDIGEKNLRMLGFGFRAPYIIHAAKKVVEGEIKIEEIKNYDYEKQLQILTSINGIGRKVADCILTYGYARRDTFPVDRWVRRGIIGNLGFNEKFNNEQLASKARKKFKEDSAYIQQYIFYGEKSYV